VSEVWAAAAAAVVGAGASYGLSSLNKQQAPATIPYQNVNPTTVQNNAISGDIASLSSANSLAGSTTTTQAQQALAARNISQPGYSTLAGDLTQQATNLAANPSQVPQSVVDQLSQYAAENNIGEGTGNASGFSQNNLVRSLGLNALQYQTQNLASATSALSTLSGTAPNVSPVSPLSFLLTPSQALQTATTNATNNQQIAQGGANAAAAAANANSNNLFDSLTSQISPLTSAGLNAINSYNSQPNVNITGSSGGVSAALNSPATNSFVPYTGPG
jgi:hypothetical protein